MKEHECIIGMLNEYDDSELVTLRELDKSIEDSMERYNYWNIMIPDNDNPKPYTLKEYCDKRFATNLERFDYCPICGKPIPWKVFRILAVGGEAK